MEHTTRLQSPLAAAVRGGDWQLVKLLLDKSARADDPVESWHTETDNMCDLYDEDGYDRHLDRTLSPN